MISTAGPVAVKCVCLGFMLLAAFWLGEASADCKYNGWNPFVYFQMGQAIKASPFVTLTSGLSELLSSNQRAMAAGTVGAIFTIVTAYFRGPLVALKFALGWFQGVPNGWSSVQPSIASVQHSGTHPSLASTAHHMSQNMMPSYHPALQQGGQPSLTNSLSTTALHPAPITSLAYPYQSQGLPFMPDKTNSPIVSLQALPYGHPLVYYNNPCGQVSVQPGREVQQLALTA